MTGTVPEVIIVGNTRYRHFARNSRDLYAPENLLPNPPSQYIWCYCISQAHNNTVYFHNDKSGTSLWVLPDINSTESINNNEKEKGKRKEETTKTMQAIGSVQSAASRQKRSTSISTAADEGINDTERRERRTVMQESIAKAVKDTLEKNQTKTNDGVKTSSINNNNNNNNNGDKNSDEMSDNMHVRDRLALWRARRDQQRQSGSQQRSASPTTQRSSSFIVTTGAAGSYISNERPPLYNKRQSLETSSSIHGMDTRRPYDVKETHAVSTERSLSNISQDQQQHQQQESTPLERDVLYDEKRDLFLKANEELLREKETALQKERLAIQRARRLQEVQQQEEEERTRLATERRRLEERRVELQKRAIERQNELLAKAEEQAMQQELIAQLNSFSEKQRQITEKVEEEGQGVLSFEKAIMNSLLGTISKEKSEPVKERRIDLRLIEDSDDDDNNDNNNKHDNQQKNQTTRSISQPQKQKQPESEKSKQSTHITFSSSLMYIGDVTGGGRDVPEFLLQRHGRGKFFYDATQKTFFDGEWRNDKRNGNGVLSLPHVAVEGVWRDDKLNGRATFQSRRLKGTAEFVDNAIEGNTIVELDCNSVFAGKVRKNGSIIDSGAITLSSGDHVEWIVDDQDVKKTQIARHNNMNNRNTNGNKKENDIHGNNGHNNNNNNNHSSGTGRCRIQFSNGDVFIGQVENYRPHGSGSYRFAATAHEYVGEFYHGFLQGHGTYRFANGNIYIGQLYKGLFHGEGEYVQQDAYTYEGSWEYGTAHGKGKLTFANGDVWEGEFDHDKRLSGRYTASRLFQL